VTDTEALHRVPLYLKYLRPDQVRDHLCRDPRLIVPVGSTEQHGPHLPLGCGTIIVERLAADLSAALGVLLAPTVEYGVNAHTEQPFAGSAGMRRKTLHRLMNDLVGAWEAGGVREFIILTAQGQEPHQEALSTLHTREAVVRTVDIFAIPRAMPRPPDGEPGDLPVHGGAVDTSLLLYLAPQLVAMERARDFVPTPRQIRRYRLGASCAIPASSPGSLGRPTLASAEEGERLYRWIYERIAQQVFGARP
jgi:creatinine amidohydrolase